MKRLLKLFPILLLFSCVGNDVDLQNYYELREDDFMILGKMVDLEEVIRESESVGKPILFYFNGQGCVNCRIMEEHVLGSSHIAKTIVKNFLLVPLTVDDRTQIPEDKRQKSTFTGKIMRSVGNVNSDLQLKIGSYGSQPNFRIMNTNEETIGYIGYTRKKREFMHFLKSALKKHKLQ